MDDSRLRTDLLSLHRALLDFERRGYEKIHGRAANGDFLQALVRDPAYTWISPLTSLIARLDELGDSADKATQRRTWRARARALLRAGGEDDFSLKCAERIQLSPDVAFAHAAAMHTLSRQGMETR